MTNPAHSGFSRWLTARLAEPESRIAVAGAITALATYVSGQTTLSTLGFALLAAGLAFVLPAPLAQEVVRVIEPPAAHVSPDPPPAPPAGTAANP